MRRPVRLTGKHAWLAVAGIVALLALAGSIKFFWFPTLSPPEPIDQFQMRQVDAARADYEKWRAALVKLAQHEQHDVAPLLAEADKLAAEGKAYIARMSAIPGIDSYQRAAARLNAGVIALLEELEADYARQAKAALDSGRLVEAKRLVERGKALRALGEQARQQGQ